MGFEGEEERMYRGEEVVIGHPGSWAPHLQQVQHVSGQARKVAALHSHAVSTAQGPNKEI